MKLRNPMPMHPTPPRDQKINNNILRNQELPNFQKKINEYLENLQPEKVELLSPSDLLNDFEEHIVQSALDVAAREEKVRPDWFTESEKILLDAIEKRNNAFKNNIKHPTESNQNKLREARHHLLREKRKAKRQWQYAYASKCKKNDFAINPKEAWDMVFKLMEGFQKHHHTYLPANFKNKKGIEAKTDNDNADILNSHFHSLFNSDVQVDLSVLDEIPQHDVRHEFSDPPTAKEVKSAIASMAYEKAPGQSGVTTDMIKCLTPEAINFYIERIQAFWKDPNTDYESWHTTILSTVYKGKGDPQDPNNHRGIALKETSEKILSIVLARRLLNQFKQLKPSTQFGHIGCQEAQHIIKRALLLRRQHGLESHAVFVDLVKAFDTVNHELLYKILEKYGLPPPLIQAIKKNYTNCKVKIKFGKTYTEIDYTTGVHQGDNMSAVLFLYVIHAFTETLRIDAQPTQFAFFPENKNGNLSTCKGRLLSQSSTAKGKPFYFNSSFYVDDSFFIFQTRHELLQTIIQLDKHFSRFGLIMHLGSEKSKSKSEAMFFPASLKQAKNESDNNILPADLLLPNNKKVHYVTKFKYLGSIITPLLNEDIEIQTRIAKAKSIMGASKSFFDNKDVDKRINAQIYIAGPLNALLWGCEAWNLTKLNLNKLTAFHHSAIRRILGIKWDQVRQKHIKNKEVRGMLCNMPNVDAFITRRTATYIGKITRSDNDAFPKKFLAAWINKSKKSGAPQLTCNNNFAESIQKILAPEKPLSSKQAPLCEWIHLAKDEASWLSYIDHYFETCRNTDFEDPNDTAKKDNEREEFF